MKESEGSNGVTSWGGGVTVWKEGKVSIYERLGTKYKPINSNKHHKKV